MYTDIATWGQFHQHSRYNFCTRRSQKRKKILMTQLYFLHFLGTTSIKSARKTLVKLTPGRGTVAI